MLKTTIQNGPLMGRLAALGHGDLVVVADCGLPIQSEVPVVDLALVRGVPTFAQVLDALCKQVVFEGAVMASESAGRPCHEQVSALLDEVTLVSHGDFKQLVSTAAVVVRCGETSPYANVALRAGVDF